MMRHIFAIIAVLMAHPLLAEPQIPDSQKVTSVTEAATMCELTQAGIDWTEKSPTILAIAFTEADIRPPSPKFERLKQCIFAWAYDRNVRLDITMKK